MFERCSDLIKRRRLADRCRIRNMWEVIKCMQRNSESSRLFISLPMKLLQLIFTKKHLCRVFGFVSKKKQVKSNRILHWSVPPDRNFVPSEFNDRNWLTRSKGLVGTVSSEMGMFEPLYIRKNYQQNSN